MWSVLGQLVFLPSNIFHYSPPPLPPQKKEKRHDGAEGLRENGRHALREITAMTILTRFETCRNRKTAGKFWFLRLFVVLSPSRVWLSAVAYFSRPALRIYLFNVRSVLFPLNFVLQGVEAYVMDASSIDAPFLLSKIAEHDANDKQTMTTTDPAHEGTVDFRGDQACAGLSYGESAAYDAVFTNAAFHWLKSPRSAIEGVWRVLRPGGRFVGEFGGHGNIAGVRIAMHAAISRRGVDPREIDPWFFPTPEEFRLLLEAVRKSLKRRADPHSTPSWSTIGSFYTTWNGDHCLFSVVCDAATQ